MAITKKRRNKNTLVNTRASTLKETIRNEVIGVFVVGMACLGLVALFSERSGVVGREIEQLLKVLAGGGRVWIPIMVGAWGLAYMNQRIPRLGAKVVGAILLWLVFLGLLHLQLQGIEAFSRTDLINEGKRGHGGGIVGAGVTALLITSIGIPGGYVVLIMGAFMGALLITNRSLIRGVQEVNQVGKELGLWMKHQMHDFINVVKNSGGENSGDKDSVSQVNLEAEDKTPKKKGLRQSN